MIIDPKLFNPGVFEYNEEYKKKLERYKAAVQRALFLNENEKNNWIILGYLLTQKQLEEGEKLIISEDLRRLKTQQSLEKIKPVPPKNA